MGLILFTKRRRIRRLPIGQKANIGSGFQMEGKFFAISNKDIIIMVLMVFAMEGRLVCLKILK